MLLERRSNPKLNPKISIYDNLKKYYDLDVNNDESIYFIHLTGDIINYKDDDVLDQRTPILPKFGINPRQKYKTTPFGIYTYPLKDSWTFYEIETNKNLKGITYPNTIENRKYVYVIKTISSINLVNVETYTEAQLEKDKELLNQLYDYDFSQKFEKPVFDNFKPEHLKFPYFKLKNITYNIAKRHSKNKIIVTWSTIFKRLGYDGIYDPGIGLIDPSELCQCVFFYKDVIKVVALYENKTYKKIYIKPSKDEKIYFINDKLFIGKMKNGVLHFMNLDISGMNIKSLKDLPWSKFNKSYIVSDNFNCSSNLLKDLEGGPIYAEAYNCYNNKLKSLKGAPDKVENFNCSYNKTLKSLEGSPNVVEEFLCSSCSIESLQYISDNISDLNCSFNELKNLKYLPKTVKFLDCSFNKLENLEYSNDIMYHLDCNNNTLESLVGAPEECVSFICVDCGLTSLKGVPKKIKELNMSNNDIRSLKDLEECGIIWCHGNYKLKLDFKPKNLKKIEGVSTKRINNFLVKNQLEE